MIFNASFGMVRVAGIYGKGKEKKSGIEVAGVTYVNKS
jgi:hypothetical protein